ncbi:MAG: right-handed parallel beta-helix repeat-containing protein [Sandaracinaceae bacterium]|nr:right-handed parallel beta-helix repeat-containing protein [Sandaracinaceae bacterium]
MRNLALAIAAVGLGACTSELCDRADAEAALLAAAPGETVVLGDCELEGPLRVPPGVTLAGTGGTVVVAPRESGAIVAIGGGAPTVIRDLRVRVDGRIGVLLRGGGAVEVRRVAVEARRGIALGAAELASLILEDVTLAGPVTGDNAEDARWVRVAPAPADPAPCPTPGACDCEPGALDADAERVCTAEGRWATWTATFGLVLSRVARAELTGVSARGFAAWGALLDESVVTWRGGAVTDTLGVGVRQVGGALSLAGVALETTRAGLRGDRPYALIATDGARLDAAGLAVRDNERYGLLVHESVAHLTDVTASGNGDAALWISECDEAVLDGAASRFSDNGFAAIVVVGSSGVRVEGATVEGTREVERAVGAIGLLRVGDGVHVTGARGPIRLAGLRLTDNARAGVTVELGAGAVTFEGVTVSGTGAQLGAVAGRASGAGRLTAESPPGWDAGIAREGATSANDLAFTGAFAAVTEALPGLVPPPGNVLGVVAPMF